MMQGTWCVYVGFSWQGLSCAMENFKEKRIIA